MVGVPAALYLAAGLLAVAASVGLAFALLVGRVPGASTSGRLRMVGVAGALVYAVGHGLGGALTGPVELRAWLEAIGLLGILIGADPTVMRMAGGLGLIVPVAPTLPAYAAAAIGTLAAGRIALGRPRSPLLAAGVAVLAIGHGLEPARPQAAAVATIIGSLLVGAWLWRASSRRILAKLLTAFAAALLAMAIVLAAVLSTVSSAQLTADELARLDRLADQLTAEIQAWPSEAVLAAQPLSRSVGTLIGTVLEPSEAADLFALSLSSQDFFLTIDPMGRVVNAFPPDLGGALRLAVAGDPLIADVREGRAPDGSGGLVSSGRTIVAFGAIPLVVEGARPEEPPAGVLVTGRLADGVWAAQRAAALDVGLIGVVGGEVVFTTGTDDAQVGTAVIEALADRSQGDLGADGQERFAAAVQLTDPQRGSVLGTLVTTSTPQVIANLESAQTRRLFGVTLVGGALALLTAGLVTRRFVLPITQLTEVAQRVGAGDLSRRAGIRAPDEVGQLAATFDDMVESLSEQRDDLTSSALRESRLRGRLESLTTSMGDGLIAVDTAGIIITFNPAAEAMTGRGARDAIGLPLGEVLVGRTLDDGLLGEGMSDGVAGGAPEDPLQLRDAMDSSVSAGRLLLTREAGAQVPIAATAAPVRSPNGDIIGRVYVLRDITTDLQVEQMKTQFLANVSHELRTPITPIKGYANVLARRDVGPERTRQFAEQILDSTKRLERIVGMIVDFAALDSGRVTFERQPVELDVLVETTVAPWRMSHPDRHIQIRVPASLPLVMTDPTYLGRCVDELLDNALKFSPDGPPVIVSAIAVAGTVRLSVADRGIGIEAEAAKRLFTDFVQADGTETRHYGGLGLGLGLVGRTLDGIGAAVEVESEPAEGTTVTLTLEAAGPARAVLLPVPPAPRGLVPAPPA